MITFKIEGREFEINEPTIKDYYEIEDLLVLTDRVDSRVSIISQLSGASPDLLKKMSISELESIWAKVSNGPLSTGAGKFEHEIEIRGTRYKFLDMTKLTVGEMADMDTLRNHPNMSKQLHKMMAILWRPIGADGNIVPHTSDGFEDRANEFLENMTIGVVLKSVNFFFHIARACFESTMASLEVELKMETKMSNLQQIAKEKTSKLQGNGHSSFTSLLTTTYLGLRKLRRSISSQRSTT